MPGLRPRRVVLTAAVSLLLAFALAFLLFVLGRIHDVFVPVHSASVHIEPLDTTVEIDLYSISHLTEYERHLRVRSPAGTIRREMRLDWGPAARTSLYLTQDGRIAILGPARDDYLVSPRPLRITRRFRLPSDGWAYLGAFDHYREPRIPEGGWGRVFRFIPAAEQAECIPILLSGEAGGPHRTRYYRQRCPAFEAPLN